VDSRRCAASRGTFVREVAAATSADEAIPVDLGWQEVALRPQVVDAGVFESLLDNPTTGGITMNIGYPESVLHGHGRHVVARSQHAHRRKALPGAERGRSCTNICDNAFLGVILSHEDTE
jgi:hypothetical protein